MERLHRKKFYSEYEKATESDDNFRREVRRDSRKAETAKPEYFPYIPYYLWRDEFYDLFGEMRKTLRRNPSFLDIGAGTGRIVRLAKTFGFKKSVGVEAVESNVISGRKIHKLSEEELIFEDAFNLTSEFLEGFDILYFYMPISKSELMTELHMNLVNKLQKSKSCREVWIYEGLPRYYPVNTMYGLKRGKYGVFFPVTCGGYGA